jgi:cell division protein FtsB
MNNFTHKMLFQLNQQVSKLAKENEELKRIIRKLEAKLNETK